MKRVKTLLILSILSACSGPDPRPAAAIPAALLAPVPQPVMRGTTDGDVWRLIAAQKAAIARGNSQLAGISCLVAARQAIESGASPADCEA